MFIANAIKDYINSQWWNLRREINFSRAREELLQGGKVYLYDVGTTNPANLFMGSSEGIVLPHPVIANYDGVFPEIHIPEPKDKYRIELRDREDNYIRTCDLSNDFTL